MVSNVAKLYAAVNKDASGVGRLSGLEADRRCEGSNPVTRMLKSPDVDYLTTADEVINTTCFSEAFWCMSYGHNTNATAS